MRLGRGGIASPVIWKLAHDCGKNKARLAGWATVLHGSYAGGAGLRDAWGRVRGCVARGGRAGARAILTRGEIGEFSLCQAN
jgi:hypothetical protein